ncbi:MAG: hypothetical protein ABI439_07705 [Rhodospirillales bacterium]
MAPFNPNKNNPAPATGKPSPTKSDDNQSADKLGDALPGTQVYLERRWLLWRVRVLADTVKEADALLTSEPNASASKGRRRTT